MFQCDICKLCFVSLEVFARHECVTSEGEVRCINLTQDRTEQDIAKDIVQQEEEEGCKWTHAPTLLLISEYQHRQDKIDSGRFRKKRAYEEIASVLKENKYPFTDAQCASSMKTLVRQYKTVKGNNNTSGCKRKTFMYEEELDSLYKASPNIRPQFVLSSIMDEDNDEDEDADAKCEKTKAAENIEEKGNDTISPKVRKTQFSEVMENMRVAADEREKMREGREQSAEKRHEDEMNLFKELINAFKNQ